MPSSIGTALRVTLFGQSHSTAVGCVVEGLPSGLSLDEDALRAFVASRAPGRFPWDTPRTESDELRILSGLNTRGETCGAPFSAIIENTNVRSRDYDQMKVVPRPGHADFTAWAKWHGAQDVPGGGHFSARVTAALCAAGGICLQELARRGIRVSAHVLEAAGIVDDRFVTASNSPEAQESLAAQMDALEDGRAFPTINRAAAARMTEAILAAKHELDSVGGIVECVVTGIPAGVGSPMFDGLEGTIARMVFGIPAVKGVEFGAGFSAARMRGSENNDPYEVRDGACTPCTNNAGGILGGISTGAPLVFSCAFKPISSIAREQDSVDLTTMQPTTISVHGRHDTCAATRAVPVVRAAAAIAVLDSLLAWPPDPVA